jgi:hypothetical protein
MNFFFSNNRIFGWLTKFSKQIGKAERSTIKLPDWDCGFAQHILTEGQILHRFNIQKLGQVIRSQEFEQTISARSPGMCSVATGHLA